MLCKAGLVYAMASEDMDSLTFATPRLTRNLLTPASAKLPVTEYDYSQVPQLKYFWKAFRRCTCHRCSGACLRTECRWLDALAHLELL